MARLTTDNTQRARDLVALYPQPRSALIPLLHLAQEQDGHLNEDAMVHIGELIGLTSAEVRGTATFYDMLFTEPVGRHLISICTNIACLLNGGYELLEHAEKSLGVRAGGRTADGEFTLEEVECIALCGNAPCLTVNWRFFGDVTTDAFDRLLDDLRAGRLKETVPPHGTLCRVRRTVGLPATAAATARPAPAPEPAPTDTPPGGHPEVHPAPPGAVPAAEGEQPAAKPPGNVDSAGGTSPVPAVPKKRAARPRKEPGT